MLEDKGYKVIELDVSKDFDGMKAETDEKFTFFVIPVDFPCIYFLFYFIHC